MKRSKTPWRQGTGYILYATGIWAGWIFSSQMKGSWRVGVLPDQKTNLIQTGVYAHIRNPYFLSCFVMYAGLFFVRPGILILGLIIAAAFIFHRMVLKEEAYLAKAHGPAYESYKKRTGRYLPAGKKE